jgi:ABC-type lipoprotein export system ATPase subunit
MPFIKYLSQDFDLMPYTTVAENVGKFYPMFSRTEKKNA